MWPVSSGSRKASSALRGNSGSSSRNSTPACASEISPGRGGDPPPTSATALALWCGARTGRWPKRRASRPCDDTLSSAALDKRLGRRHRRQQAGEAVGEHRLAGARRPDQQQAVRAGRGHLQRAARAGLALDVGQVGQRRRRGGRLARRPGQLARAGGVAVAGQEGLDDVAQRARGADVHALDPRRLGRALRRQHEAARAAALAHGQRQRERAAHGPQLAGQRQLARELAAREARGVQQALRGQHAERDRQVEAARLLGQVGRRQVDGDLLVVRKREAALRERRAHALARLLDLGVGQSDQREAGQAVGEVDFDDDLGRMQADQGAGVDDGEASCEATFDGARGAAGRVIAHV